MVSSNGAQRLDPLGPIVGQQTKPGNNLMITNAVHYNDILESVISVNDVDRSEAILRNHFHPQNPIQMFISANGPAAIEHFLARTGGVEHVDGPQPLDRRWPAPQYRHHHHQIAESPASYCVKYEEISPCEADEISSRSVVVFPAPAPPCRDSAAAERRRRCSEEMREKSIERKQKRMIKNRESAARSRARKQAHMKRLEQEVRQLEEMNYRLKLKLVETGALSRQSIPQKSQLRRINSAHF